MVMDKTIYIKNIEELDKLAKKFADNIKYPSVFLLTGDLGTGKTAFTKLIAKNLGIKEHITSPTFLIHKSYNFDDKIFHHYDIYRLSKYEDLREIGFEEKKGRYVLVIEWPEKIKKLENIIKNNKNIKNIIKINFYHTHNENKRKIIIHNEK